MSAPPLPILAIVAEAYRTPFRNFRAYLRLSWLPFLIILVVSLGIQSYERDLAGLGEHADTEPSAFGGFALTVIWLLTIPVSTAWMRHILANSEQPARFVVGRAEWVYLFRSVCLTLLIVLFMALIMLPPGLAVYLIGSESENGDLGLWNDFHFYIVFMCFVFAAAISVFISTRFILALPAAAVGNPSRLRDAFAATKGQMWSLFSIFLLVSAPGILMWILDSIWGGDDHAVSGDVLQSLCFAIADHMVTWLALPIADAALALAYRHLGGMTEPNTTSASPA